LPPGRFEHRQAVLDGLHEVGGVLGEHQPAELAALGGAGSGGHEQVEHAARLDPALEAGEGVRVAQHRAHAADLVDEVLAAGQIDLLAEDFPLLLLVQLVAGGVDVKELEAGVRGLLPWASLLRSMVFFNWRITLPPVPPRPMIRWLLLMSVFLRKRGGAAGAY
jgi:hypothetical protein